MTLIKKDRALTLPAIIVVAIVTQLPILATLVNSLVRWIVIRPDLPRQFVGLKYYLDAFKSPEFWIVFKNTLVLTATSLTLCLGLGLFTAFVIYRHFFGVGIVRTLLIAPFFIPDSVIGVYWRNVMLGTPYGLVPKLLTSIGLTAPDFIAANPLGVVILLIVWKWTPFFMLVLTAGLQGISDEIFEASIIDGASWIQRIRRIILPMLMKHITISVILGLIFVLKTFGLIFTTTLGGPGYASTNFPYYVYRTSLVGWNVGQGAAIAVIIVIISLIIITKLFKVLKSSFTES